MLESPCLKIGGRHSYSDPSAGVESKIWRKGSADFANGRIVDRELHTVERHFGVSFASPKRLPPLSEGEVVEDFDEAEARRKAKDQSAVRLYQTC
jgi:hypothetical protein